MLEELQNRRPPGSLEPMTTMQTGFIAFTFLAPALLWLLSRKVQSAKMARSISEMFAAILVVAVALNLWRHWQDDLFAPKYVLPMQLCDWAAVATLVALLSRRAMAFELAYFWGVAGTMQALFTPAANLGNDLFSWCFYIIHSVIPASVFWLIFEFRMSPRPGAMWKVLVWSEVYLVCAIAANSATGANFGFLAHRPEQKTLLDFLPDPHWLYILCINSVGVLFFLLLDLPWVVRRRFRSL